MSPWLLVASLLPACAGPGKDPPDTGDTGDTGVAGPLPWTAIAVESWNSCGIRGGTAECWGDDSTGVVSATPSVPLVSVSVGWTGACGLSAEGEVTCWGDDSRGLVSDAPAGAGYSSLDIGGSYGCVLDPYGLPVCWGRRNEGQPESELVPVPEVSFQSQSSSGVFSCGITLGGEIACWGRHSDGGEVLTTPPAGRWASVSVGTLHACALDEDSVPSCWGFEEEGEIEVPLRPVDVIVAGAYETCRILGEASGVDAGSLACRGTFEGADPERYTPPSGTFVEVALDAHGCARSEAGELSCWGADEAGQADVPP